MGGKYWITGVQLGIIKALAGNIDISETIEILKVITEVEDKQFIMDKKIDEIIDNFIAIDKMTKKKRDKHDKEKA